MHTTAEICDDICSRSAAREPDRHHGKATKINFDRYSYLSSTMPFLEVDLASRFIAEDKVSRVKAD